MNTANAGTGAGIGGRRAKRQVWASLRGQAESGKSHWGGTISAVLKNEDFSKQGRCGKLGSRGISWVFQKHEMYNRLTSGGCKLHSMSGAQGVGRGRKMSPDKWEGSRPGMAYEQLRSLDLVLPQVWIKHFPPWFSLDKIRLFEREFLLKHKGKRKQIQNRKQTHKSLQMNSSQTPHFLAWLP